MKLPIPFFPLLSLALILSSANPVKSQDVTVDFRVCLFKLFKDLRNFPNLLLKIFHSFGCHYLTPS